MKHSVNRIDDIDVESAKSAKSTSFETWTARAGSSKKAWWTFVAFFWNRRCNKEESQGRE